MARKIGLLAGGIVLIGLFLAWMLFKGTDPVQSWTDANQLLGLVAWGVAWLCVLSGAALVARALFHQPPNSVADRD